MREKARRGGGLLVGMLAGAVLMYIFDPVRGVRRRALARDKVVHAGHELAHLGEAAAARGRDLRNRARGAVVEARSRLHAGQVDDEILEARVRSRIGHRVNNPGPVEVSVRDGLVTLSGPLPAAESERLLATVAATPGVHDVIDRLELHQEAGSVPSLQGQPDSRL